MKRVVKMMNAELGDSCLASDVLDGVFDMWWPHLEAQVNQVLQIDKAADNDVIRSDRELLEEILGLTRRLSAARERRLEFEHPIWDDLTSGLFDLIKVVRARVPDEETLKAIGRLMRPLEYLMHKDIGFSGRRSPGRWIPLMMEFDELLASDIKHKILQEPPSGESPA